MTARPLGRLAAGAMAVLFGVGALPGRAPGVAPPDPFGAAGVVRSEPPRAAPSLSVVVADGEWRLLPALRGRPVMLWVFASW